MCVNGISILPRESSSGERCSRAVTTTGFVLLFLSAHDITLTTRCIYAEAIYEDEDATLDDVREAVTTLEDVARTARRVLGGAHPITAGIERDLQMARAGLSAREEAASGDVSAVCEALGAMTPGDA